MTDKVLWDYHQNENRISLLEGYFRQNFFFGIIKKHLPKGAKILEIGFGDGCLLDKLSHAGYTLYGQDLSDTNIEITKKQWPEAKVTYLLGDDSGKLLVENESMDGFIAAEVFEHMTDEECVVSANEMQRVLKAGGFGFISFPYKENIDKNTNFCPNCNYAFHKWGHKQSWNEPKIRQLFQQFEVVKIRRFISIGHAHYQNPLTRSVLLMLNAVVGWFPTCMEFIPSSYFVLLRKKG